MSTKNLYDDKAREKIKELAEDIDYCMLVTNMDEKPLSAVPMSTKQVDDHGAVWFLSKSSSEHNKNIQKDSDVQLLYSGTSDMEFLSIYGEAFIETNREVIHELYSPADNAWFDGKDDPEITAIKINPKEAYYWDNKDSKMVTLFKLGMAAATGKNQDIGEKGKLEL
ncbi:pyridoxamine 5'-phosphate oxidase family protein [Christiangramia sabulilitoris]|uniref:Pyridoxamine 5'-phosphate oxidase family protein n=1 Tax=Christiangramia sabulilitoris TaxID=2583991 RepID=A0A550HZZ5_9FLAO|nr:pyridoxamine 5'-phosphate oxidase family protein [Christiangramia sabulilitoris]TRO64138.1 pyridoxamine 5'-phosphate oxidase family protein [Christiangramia sabulilitoris]